MTWPALSIRQTGVDVSRTALRKPGVLRSPSVHAWRVSMSFRRTMPRSLKAIRRASSVIIASVPRRFCWTTQGGFERSCFRRCIRVFDESRRFAPQFDETDLTTLPPTE